MVGVPMRRAQVSVMIILGVLLLGIAGGAIAVSKKVVNTRQEANLKLQIRDVFETGSVENYIQLCVSDALQEALLLVGEQGGILLAPQVGGFSNTGGSVACDPVTDTPRPFPQCPVDLGGDMVGLYRVGAITPGFTAPASSYPADLYGLPTMPGLFPCHDEGYSFNPDNPCRYPDRGQPNLGSRDHLPRLCKSNADIIACSAVPTDGSNFRAVQSQMEYHMAESIDTCVAIGIAGFAQDGLNVTPEPSSVSLTLGERATSAVANVPVLIKAHKTGTQKSFTFTANEAVGLPRSFALMQQLISQDTGDIDFHLGMPSTWPESLAVPAGMQVLLRRDFYGTDDLLIINDTASVLRGHPYVLRFLISDRPPMLKRIGFDAGPDFDMIVPVGAKLEFRPLADDPDDDKVTYTYHGWKADYEDLRDDAGNLHRVLHSAMATVPANAWQTSAFYTAPAAGQCDNPLTGQPEPGRCASYQTTADDAGDHVIVIVARAGTYVDWQRVRIRIEGSPEATASGNNPYPDMDPNLASFEDPYMLSGIGSDQATAGSGIYSYEWKLFKPGDSTPTHTFTVGDPEVWLTTLTRNLAGHLNEWAPVAPLSIWDDFPRTYADIDSFPSGRKGFTAIGDWRAELVVRTADGSASTPVERSIQVQACLPHRNDAAPYPFNKVQGDTFTTDAEDFFANHTCCAANGTIKEASDQCYQFSEYTCRTYQWDAFSISPPLRSAPDVPQGHYFYSQSLGDTVDLTLNTISSPLFPLVATPPMSSIDKSYSWRGSARSGASDVIFDSTKNDVYKRTVTAQCSGERGNVCNGAVIETIDNYDGCGDYEYCYYGNDACQKWSYVSGGENAILCGTASSQAAPVCADAVGANAYPASPPSSGLYLVRKVVSGDGSTCEGTSAASDAQNAYGNRLVSNGLLNVLSTGQRAFVGLKCNYYDHYGYQNAQSDADALTDDPAVTEDRLPGLRDVTNRLCQTSGGVAPQPDDNKRDFYTNVYPSFMPGYSKGCVGCTGVKYGCSDTSFAACRRTTTIKNLDDACSTAVDGSCPSGQGSWCDDCLGNNRCNGNSCWIKGGEAVDDYTYAGQYGCCGDDPNEHYVECKKSAVVTFSCDAGADSKVRACCNTNGNCVTPDNRCVDNGGVQTIGASKYVCTTDTWHDPDESAAYCDAATGATTNYINPSGSGQQRCCGDDSGESWTRGAGLSFCCNGVVSDDNAYCQGTGFVMGGVIVQEVRYSSRLLPSGGVGIFSSGWSATACDSSGKLCAQASSSGPRYGVCANNECVTSGNVRTSVAYGVYGVSKNADVSSSSVTFSVGCNGIKNAACDASIITPPTGRTEYGFFGQGVCTGVACQGCASSETVCTDGVDNDCDGRVDCIDDDCSGRACDNSDDVLQLCGGYAGSGYVCTDGYDRCAYYSGGMQYVLSGTYVDSITNKCVNGIWLNDQDADQSFCEHYGHTWLSSATTGVSLCCGDDGSESWTLGGDGNQYCCAGSAKADDTYCPSLNAGNFVIDGNLASVALWPNRNFPYANRDVVNVPNDQWTDGGGAACADRGQVCYASGTFGVCAGDCQTSVSQWNPIVASEGYSASGLQKNGAGVMADNSWGSIMFSRGCSGKQNHACDYDVLNNPGTTYYGWYGNGICSASQCVACGASEIPSNGLDDNCDGTWT